MSFVCCERQNGSKYVHTCACPEVRVFHEVVTEKLASLCGTMEHLGFESEPAKVYKQTDWEIPPVVSTTRTCFCSSVDRIESTVSSPQRSGTWNICSGPNPSVPFTSNKTVYGYSYNCSSDPPSVVLVATTPSTISGTDHFFSAGGPFFTPVSATRTERVVPDDTEVVCGDSYVKRPSYTIIEELVSEDTDAAALDRAVNSVSLDRGYGPADSLWETRGGRDRSFSVKISKYCFVCTGLVEGVAYEGSAPVQRRPAITNDTQSWEALSDATFSFTATKVFEIVGGTLNSAITDQDFIDQDYSEDPEDYGLSSDSQVIFPSTNLDNIQGWEYLVGRDDVNNTKEPKVWRPV